MSLFVTYISNDRDYKGVLALHHNLKFKLKSPHPFGCVILEDGVSQKVQNIFEKVGILIFKFNLRKILEEKYGFENQDAINFIIQKHYYGKFLIHDLNTKNIYDKIIYLDSDLFILKPIDFLFDRIDSIKKPNEIHMTYDLSERGDGFAFKEDRFNSGVILCSHNPQITDLLFELMRDVFCASRNADEISKVLLTDQTVYECANILVEKNIFDVKHLEYRFNCVSGIAQGLSEKGILKDEDVHIIHFILKPKPWDLIDISDDVVNTFLYSDSEKHFFLWKQNYLEMVENLHTKIFSKNVYRSYQGKNFVILNERTKVEKPIVVIEKEQNFHHLF